MNQPANTDCQKLGDSLGYMLGVASRRVSLLQAQRLKDYDISTEQWAVLYHIQAEEGLIQKDLAERCAKDKPTVTRILDTLEKKALITRRLGKQDRRAFQIYPTDKGKKLVDLTAPIEQQSNSAYAQELGQTNYHLLIGLLNQVIEHADLLLKQEAQP